MPRNKSQHRPAGWIAGLQLAGLSIKSAPDPARFIRSFTGSDRYILDYFIEEVSTRQPDEIQKFPLTSSLLERFCALLCDEVTGRLFETQRGLPTGSQAVSTLEKAPVPTATSSTAP